MDVETILNQIRERVVSEENARLPGTAVSTTASSSNGSNQDDALARLSEQLTVTGRAWNRLPPIFSNRHGTLARVELWIKNTCWSLTRWFTWEQVNFNRAVHDALSDVTKILMVEAQELAALRVQLSGEMRREFLVLRSDLDAQATELQALNNNHAEYRADVETRLKNTNDALSRISNMLADLTEESRGGSAQLAQQTSGLATALREEQSVAKSQQAEELNRRLAELVTELKEEQRVCFRQLSLEASEAAVLEDRGRRALDARLEKVEKSLQARKG
ncbi:MAG TPA: hypothetical protein DC054_25650 [Blastocatellia bacterium]|nr:hypothetical protein [Blastocatellia bacterium]